VMTAVQQLAQMPYQARVISVLESLAKGAPAVGFLVGGAVTSVFNPRVAYALAGMGVLAVLAIASLALLRVGWRGDAAQ